MYITLNSSYTTRIMIHSVYIKFDCDTLSLETNKLLHRIIYTDKFQ